MSSILAVAAIVLAALALLGIVADTSGLALAIILLGASHLVGGRLFRIGR
jgi:hypothetical protein